MEPLVGTGVGWVGTAFPLEVQFGGTLDGGILIGEGATVGCPAGAGPNEPPVVPVAGTVVADPVEGAVPVTVAGG